MLFRTRRQKPSRRQRWRDFARRLELADASSQEVRLRDWFDLGESPLAPLYGLRRHGQPTLFLFDQERARHGPAGTVTSLRTGVLLRAPAALSEVPLRAQARGDPVLESIAAGRTGSRRLTFDRTPAFDAQVSVFARDEEAAREWLSRPVQAVVQRLLSRGEGVSLVVGNRHVLALCQGPEPAPFEAMEAVAADLLSLYAMVGGAVGLGERAADGDRMEDAPDADR